MEDLKGVEKAIVKSLLKVTEDQPHLVLQLTQALSNVRNLMSKNK